MAKKLTRYLNWIGIKTKGMTWTKLRYLSMLTTLWRERGICYYQNRLKELELKQSVVLCVVLLLIHTVHEVA